MYALTHIIYVSHLRPGLDGVTLKDLLKRARANNGALEITGVLVQCGERLLHILEGNPDTVDAVFARIARDSRHGEVSLLVRENAEQRLFDHCPLGFTSLSRERIAYLVGAPEMGGLCVSELNVGRAKRLFTAIANGSRAARTGPHRVVNPPRSVAA